MSKSDENITLIGLGSIGISFAALYLQHTSGTISVYDPRPDLTSHIQTVLPGYLSATASSSDVDDLISSNRLRICDDLASACHGATLVQEQGPENLAFKASLWAQVLPLVQPSTHLWSSTSGITASRQASQLDDSARRRLLVVHPFNPPHIMPLIELVPSPDTADEEVQFATNFFEALGSGHVPVVLRKECAGFVGNRLAFVLLREACHLVAEGVVSVEDLDRVVENSLGPRWAVTGPFRSYHYGGGAKGLDGFMSNLGGTVQEIWDGAGERSLRGTKYHSEGEVEGEDWASGVVRKTEEAYGLPTAEQFAERDRKLNSVLAAKRS